VVRATGISGAGHENRGENPPRGAFYAANVYRP
jgi:hypothetical protein